MSSFSPHCQIYIRESNGVSYQHKYMQQQVLSNLLAEVLGNHLSSKIRAVYKGRLLELEQTLKQNKVKPNEIIHLINLSRDKEQNGSIYLSFEDKIYKVNFYVEESVKNLKERIQQQTSVPQSQQIILTNSIQLENSKMLKDYEIRNGDFLCMAQAKQRKPLVLDLPQIIFPKINKFDKRRGSQCITQKNEPVRVAKNSIIFEQCGNARKQNEKLVLSCTTPQSANLQYGPSPLSEYDSSFKNCMENWMGMQPETISQRFIQEAYWNEVGSRFDNSKEEQHRLKDTQDLTPVVFDSYFEDNQGLCESEVFDEMGNQHPTLSNVELTRSQPYSKIIPKFVYSTEIESPTKKL